jgi:hypothetical protein
LGVRSEDGSPTNLDSEELAHRLRKLLASSRMRQSAAGKLVPVGVTIDYDVTLTGFRGRRATVRWSLHRSAARPLQLDWLRNEPAQWLKGEANKDTASDSFWVPLPNMRGTFFVRVGVYDEHGGRLTYKDSDEIR